MNFIRNLTGLKMQMSCIKTPNVKQEDCRNMKWTQSSFFSVEISELKIWTFETFKTFSRILATDLISILGTQLTFKRIHCFLIIIFCVDAKVYLNIFLIDWLNHFNIKVQRWWHFGFWISSWNASFLCLWVIWQKWWNLLFTYINVE